MTEKIRAKITGIGAYVPDYVLTNDELSRMVDTNDEWITTRVGIKERRILKIDGEGSSLALSDKELTRYIIGTIATLDMPLSPPAALNAVLSREYTGLSQDEIQAYRDGVLSVTTEKLQSLAPMLRAVLAQGYRSAVASETKAKECADLFDSLRPIR